MRRAAWGEPGQSNDPSGSRPTSQASQNVAAELLTTENCDPPQVSPIFCILDAYNSVRVFPDHPLALESHWAHAHGQDLDVPEKRVIAHFQGGIPFELEERARSRGVSPPEPAHDSH